MDNSCFYYGANTAAGGQSGIFEPEKIEKILVVKGGSPELKDKIFIELSEELVQKSIQNEMLFSFENCCGIYCDEEKILIADEKILKEKQIENAEKIIDLNELFSETIPQELLHIYEKEYDKKIKYCKYIVKNDELFGARCDTMNMVARRPAADVTGKVWL